jgi:uncharacterized protein
MKLIIFGGTGFIGTELLKSGLFKESNVVLVTRNPKSKHKVPGSNVLAVGYNGSLHEGLKEHLSGEYGIINLAGESISRWPWSSKQKEKIVNSRVRITQAISDLVNKSPVKPTVIIQGSASGYYGSDPDREWIESSPSGHGFLSKVVARWENSLTLNEPGKTRVVFIRTGLVLGNSGGLLPNLLLPFRFFAGGHTGNGRQWMPWIHIRDEVSAIEYLVRNNHLAGVFNLVSPHPVQMKMLMKAIGKRLGRPSWLHIPAFVLKLTLGQFAEELLLTSQKILPDALTRAGFEFGFPDIETALDDLIEKRDG